MNGTTHIIIKVTFSSDGSDLANLGMGGTKIFELAGSEEARRGHGGKRKWLLSNIQLRKTGKQVLWPLTTGNKKKFSIDCAVF